MEIHDLLNYTETEQRLQEFLKKESSSYKGAVIVCLVLAVIAFFIFPLISLVFVFAAGYLFWDSRKNKDGTAVLLLGTVTAKKHWRRKTFSEADGPDKPTIWDHYELVVDTDKKFSLVPGKANPETYTSQTKNYVVNETIYRLYEKGEDIGLVMSPANDLMGYSKANNLVLLLYTKEFSDGTSKTISMSIPQTHLTKFFGWEELE